MPSQSNETSLSMTDEQSFSMNPPGIWIFNVGRTRASQIADGPNSEEELLPMFISTLQSIQKKGYIVLSATYSPQGADIFIQTDDEDWDDNVGSTTVTEGPA
ncbi:hypothetical protein LshimejAT787_0601010 [Lyophyllum shimeji]|uniref:Uncharacterized protein n=1 Tax=Lyophyllum shimeji TaxID=47721 RepID=A0A9P3PP26_LYOSH|nr:hypothetical protein LshimejAT787_0601010 [Lyophyllum shimeji]